MTLKLLKKYLSEHGYKETAVGTWTCEDEKLCVIIFNGTMITCRRNEEKYDISRMYKIREIFRIKRMSKGLYIELFDKRNIGLLDKFRYWILSFCNCEKIYKIENSVPEIVKKRDAEAK